MREILFRAKSGNEWVYGDLVHLFGNDNIVIHHAECEGETCNYIDIVSKTVGQFTGMFDSTKWEQLTEEEQLDWLKNHTIDEWNGKEIFEGDIVDCWSEGINAQGAVQQRIDGLWIIYPAWQNQQFWGLCPNRNGSTSVKIIGNIHDNSELLKGGAE